MLGHEGIVGKVESFEKVRQNADNFRRNVDVDDAGTLEVFIVMSSNTTTLSRRTTDGVVQSAYTFADGNQTNPFKPSARADRFENPSIHQRRTRPAD